MTGKIIGRGSESNGFYLLDDVVANRPYTNVSRFARQSNLSSFLHHYRYGHPSFPVLKKLYPELEPISCFPHGSCEFSKHHRASYPPRVNTRATSLFELVHSDV